MPRPMSAQARNEKKMCEDAVIRSRTAKTTLEKLRCACLARGATGIMGLSRMFKIADNDGSKTLSREEFKTVIFNYGVKKLRDDEFDELFQEFDNDGSGLIGYNSFLRAMRPPMSQRRQHIIDLAFQKLDKTSDGIVTVEDMYGTYNIKKHPRFLNGDMTEKQLLKEFLRKFEVNGTVDGKVTREEFMDYYAGVSASIDCDAYFDLMMRQAWKL